MYTSVVLKPVIRAASYREEEGLSALLAFGETVAVLERGLECFLLISVHSSWIHTILQEANLVVNPISFLCENRLFCLMAFH
jgi:hypothetical protein